MLTQPIDLTAKYNANSGAALVLDLGKWDSVTIQIVSGTGAATFQGTNDGGVYNIASSAQNFSNYAGYEMAAPATPITTGTSGMFRFDCYCKYLRLNKTGVTAAGVYMIGSCNV